MSCELETMYIIDPRELLSKPVFECIESKKSWADALRVSDSTTIGTYNLLVKMLDGLGCPTWVDAPETTYDEESAVLEPSHDLAAADGQNSVRVFFVFVGRGARRGSIQTNPHSSHHGPRPYTFHTGDMLYACVAALGEEWVIFG